MKPQKQKVYWIKYALTEGVILQNAEILSDGRVRLLGWAPWPVYVPRSQYLLKEEEVAPAVAKMLDKRIQAVTRQRNKLEAMRAEVIAGRYKVRELGERD